MGGVMSSIVVSGDTSGAITIAAPAVAGTNTLTLPANTGTILTTASTFSGTGPAFSAYQSSAQSIPNASFTKLQLQTKVFDTASCFDNSTNYRFTPNVAGYYQINGQVSIGGAALGYSQITIYKNGSEYSRGSVSPNNTSVGAQSTVSNLVYLNGSTDYVELYVYQNSGGSVTNQNNTFMNYFSGSMVRAA